MMISSHGTYLSLDGVLTVARNAWMEYETRYLRCEMSKVDMTIPVDYTGISYLSYNRENRPVPIRVDDQVRAACD